MNRLIFSITISALLCSVSHGQVNYVGNPSFEEDCLIFYPKYWHGLDSGKCCEGFQASECAGNNLSPKNPFTFQYARTGFGYFLNTLYFNPNPRRCYPINRLRFRLEKDVTYCVRFFVNISNNSTVGMDGFGAYFASKKLDTITVCPDGMFFINPQIQNPTNNIIADTLGWTAITGTFTASGDEVYMVIGNFKTDAMTNTVAILPPPLPFIGTDVCLDDVSCVPIDLPADAGPDKTFFTGDSVFIGRTPDVGINEECLWYQLPNMATPVATIAGLYVKPVTTTTYVLRQQLWCSGVKWDTVVVYKDYVDVPERRMLESALVSPNPASAMINISCKATEIIKFTITDQLGRTLKEGEFRGGGEQAQIQLAGLPEGVYLVNLTLNEHQSSRKLVICK